MQKTFKSGMFFTAIGQYSNVLIQLIINVVLSRIIPVEEFGILATVQVFLVFFQVFVSAGMGPAIIQNRNLKLKDYGILFNYMTIFSIILALAFGMFGFAIAKIYDNSVYINLFWLMSVIVLSEGMNVVPTAVLNKSLQFKTLNMRLLICNALGAVFGIATAFMGFGVYSLIISVALPAIASLIANFFIVKIEYTKSMDSKPVKELWKFARNQMGFTVLNYFSRNSDNLLIGKLLGPVPLANYQKSYQLITTPNTVFLGVISPVLQPVLAEHQENVKLIRDTFMKIVHVLGLIGFPLTAFMVINAKEIIFFLFGKQWYGAVLPFSILAFSTWAQMLISAANSIFMARNRSKTLLYTGMLSTFLILTFTIIGISFGKVTTVALFVCIAYLINFFSSYGILMYKVLESNFMMLVGELKNPIIIGVVVAIVGVISTYLFSWPSNFLTLVVRGICWLGALVLSLVVSGELKHIKQLWRN